MMGSSRVGGSRRTESSNVKKQSRKKERNSRMIVVPRLIYYSSTFGLFSFDVLAYELLTETVVAGKEKIDSSVQIALTPKPRVLIDFLAVLSILD